MSALRAQNQVVRRLQGWRLAKTHEMSDNPAMFVVGIAFVLALFGSGIGVAYFVGRKGGQSSAQLLQRALPDKHVRELERCLELGACATRDAEVLSAMLAQQSLPADSQVASAVRQLIDSTKNFSQRVNTVGADAQLTPPKIEKPPLPDAPASPAADPSAAPLDPSKSELGADFLAQDEVDSAPRENPDEKLPESPFEDARRFKRSSFRGSAKATIYPRHPGPGREPVQCTVLTRDLSCGGIGIAHCEQLFPKQIIVLDAVGKLLVGEVRWCRREDDQFYVAGCRLVKANG